MAAENARGRDEPARTTPAEVSMERREIIFPASAVPYRQKHSTRPVNRDGYLHRRPLLASGEGGVKRLQRVQNQMQVVGHKAVGPHIDV
jgi:hypothetical protein